jgi:predicted MFS family arabinose efflux permease
MRTTTQSARGGYRSVSAVLFLCLFAAQAGAIALAPVLADVARDFDVSTPAAGQLRTIAGLVAGVTALALGRLTARVGLGRQLLGGAILLALGALASAAAPSIGLLAAAQVPVGAGIAILTTAGTLAAAEWVPREQRAATLSWALNGQPAAWIVGMPLLGAAGERSWRYAWLLFPLAAALVAAAAVGRRSGEPPAQKAPARMHAALAAPALRRWLATEVLANTAWAATLVYAGSLFVESYAASTAATGIALALGAGAYVSGNLASRRLADHEPRQPLVGLAVALSASTFAFGAFRPSPVVSTALFAAAAFAAGGRTFLSSSFGLAAPPELRPGAMAMRSASMQFGYFTGSLAGGVALALGGYPALGAAIATLFLSAALILGQLPARVGARRLSFTVVASPEERGVSAAWPAGSDRRHVDIGDRPGQAARTVGASPPERKSNARPRPDRGRAVGRRRPRVCAEDGADPRLSAA